MAWRPYWIDDRMASTDHYRPCICGRLMRTSLYKNKLMSPERSEMRFGIGLFIVANGFLLFYFWPAAAALVLLAALFHLVLVAAWMIKRHSLRCALRWASLNFFGLGRWASF